MAAGYMVTVNNQSSISQTVGRVTSANGINGAVANVNIPALTSMTFKVNSALTGYGIESQYSSATPIVLDSANAPGSISNSVAATDVYTKSIPGNLLGTLRSISGDIIGDFFNNTGGAVTFRWQLKYGGTTIYDSTAQSWAASANARYFHLQFNLAAAGATNAQTAIAKLFAGQATGLGGVASPTGDFIFGAPITGLAIDSTAAQNLILTCTLGTASGSATLNVRHAHVVLD